jgi:hypothetical protein
MEIMSYFILDSQIENKDANLKTQKKFRHWDHKFEWTSNP